MPRSRRRLNRPAASAEPVEPPETSAWARPSATALAAWTIDASGVERTANAGSAALAIETGASITSTPAGTAPISAAGPNRSTPMPCAAARRGARGDLAGTEIGPARIHGDRDHGAAVRAGLVGARCDHFAALVAAADRADPVGQPRAVALRAGVVRRRADLVLRATLGRARVRLLLLGDGHCGWEASRGTAVAPRRHPLSRTAARRACPAGIGLALVVVLGAGGVEVDAAHRAQAGAVGAAQQRAPGAPGRARRGPSRATSSTPCSTYGELELVALRRAARPRGRRPRTPARRARGSACTGPSSVASKRSRSA